MADPDPPADENGMQWPTTDTPSGSAPTATDPVTGASTATSAATSSSARSAESRWATSAASGSVANGAALADLHTAIGDPETLRGWALHYRNGATLVPWLDGLAAAVEHTQEGTDG